MTFEIISKSFNTNANANIYNKLNIMSSAIGSQNSVNTLKQIRESSKNQYNALLTNNNNNSDLKKKNDYKINRKTLQIEKLKKEIIQMKKNKNKIKQNIISKNQSLSLDNDRVDRKTKIIIFLVFLNIVFFLIASKIFSDIKSAIN